MFSRWSFPEKKARKWLWIALAAVAALQFYYVREMIAAFVIFAVLFALACGAALLVVLIDQVSERSLDWIHKSAVSVWRTAGAAASLFGALIAKRGAHAAQVPSVKRGPAIHV